MACWCRARLSGTAIAEHAPSPAIMPLPPTPDSPQPKVGPTNVTVTPPTAGRFLVAAEFDLRVEAKEPAPFSGDARPHNGTR